MPDHWHQKSSLSLNILKNLSLVSVSYLNPGLLTRTGWKNSSLILREVLALKYYIKTDPLEQLEINQSAQGEEELPLCTTLLNARLKKRRSMVHPMK